MQNPLVAIVILNYNGVAFLKKFLPSVLASTYDNKKIIVADNASTDQSLTYLQQYFPEVELLSLSENYGFAEGYNQALKQVKADYYVLLNSDVKVTSNWIEPIIQLMENHTDIAVCQPKILSYYQPQYFEYAGAAGGLLDRYAYPFARGRVFDNIEKDEGQYDDVQPIFWASGAAMFVKASVYRDLGGLYGYFFAHQEEIDFCWRVQNAGYKVYYCGFSTVYHVGGGTLPKGHYKKTYLNFRNSLVMMYRNLAKSEKTSTILVRLLLDGVFACKSLLSLDFSSVRAVWNAHIDFYKWIYRNRKEVFTKTIPRKNLTGWVDKSVVWEYFVRKNIHFYK